MTELEKAAFKNVFDSTLTMRYEIRTSHKVDLEKAVLPYLEAIGHYNEFNPEVVMALLKEFDGMAPKKHYEEDNPNEGSRVWDISIGREGSCVLYIHWNDFGWNNYDTDQMDRAVNDLVARVAEEVGKADEYDYKREELGTVMSGKMGYSHEVRIWWD